MGLNLRAGVAELAILSSWREVVLRSGVAELAILSSWREVVLKNYLFSVLGEEGF